MPIETIFDMWNSGSVSGSSNYGRFSIYLDTLGETVPGSGPPLGDTPLCIAYNSGTFGIGGGSTPLAFSLNSGSIFDNQWHHYAVSVSSGTASLYYDGALHDTIIGTSTSKLEGTLNATIGSNYAGTSANGVPLTNVIGWNKLSASLDEFRFWKTARTGEQIGINWNTQVYGGTNTDTANTDLGVYYKFNEGIMAGPQDATVLDYSGRISNGDWTGYSSGARSLTSALVESGASLSEFKDPIVYDRHPDVVALREELRLDGLVYDQQNNASLYNSIPSWIREDDATQENVLKITQVMSSYLDTLQNQISQINKIKDIGYPTGSQKPYNFINRNLRNLGFSTEDFFIDATLLERFMDKNNKENLEQSLAEVKNLIYQNIYNNLTYIMTSKGTQKSFRNLARCFGVSEDLLKLNTYSNGEIYTLQDTYESVALKKNTISFNHPTRFDGTIFQTASTESPSLAFISSSGPVARLHGITVEGDFIFPRQKDVASSLYFDIPFAKASLFGMKETNKTNQDWLTPDNADLQVYAVREEINSPNAYFQLTSSQMGIDLRTDIFPDVYDNERWVLAAKVRNPALNTTSDYVLEFQGVSYDGEHLQDSFSISASLPNVTALALLDAPKRLYAGAYRTDFTGSVVHKANALASSLRYWGKHLSDDEVSAHAKDAQSFGLKDPNRPLFNADNDMPATDTLKLHWDFELVNSSSTGGNFDALDTSAGSTQTEALYPTFGNYHSGKGFGFPASSDAVSDIEYVNTLVKTAPEVTNGSDMVSVLSEAEQVREEYSSPTNLVFSIEKSLYQTISDEMIRFFSTMKDFGSLYNGPADKYRRKHSELETMRRNFFDRMENSPDVNKFYEYFKWIDDAVIGMLRQILPASADVTDGSINIIEGHVLERNKFEHKLPQWVISQELADIASLENVATNFAGEGIGSGISGKVFNEDFWDGRILLEMPSEIETGNVIVDADRLQILNVVNARPRTVSQLGAVTKEPALENRDVTSATPLTQTGAIDSTDGFAEEELGNGKVKIFAKVVITG
jgi:hypothetical protein